MGLILCFNESVIQTVMTDNHHKQSCRQSSQILLQIVITESHLENHDRQSSQTVIQTVIADSCLNSHHRQYDNYLDSDVDNHIDSHDRQSSRQSELTHYQERAVIYLVDCLKGVSSALPFAYMLGLFSTTHSKNGLLNLLFFGTVFFFFSLILSLH